MKAFVVLPLRGLQSELPALLPFFTVGGRLSILKRECDDDEGGVDQGHAALS